MGNESKLEVAVLGLEGNAEALGFLQGSHLNIGPGFERMKELQQHINTGGGDSIIREIFTTVFTRISWPG